jgi:hypothetical protein
MNGRVFHNPLFKIQGVQNMAFPQFEEQGIINMEEEIMPWRLQA